MSDDLTKRQPQDKSKISLTEDWEVRYWTKAFGVTEAQLRAAVKAVGHGSATVKKHLGQ
ncbi:MULTISPECIES: DUF3606 domain-containing protein [unclassified Lysobacter]|uniref:DUF3606 domain-containing protein n=1 Tax=unclassified Lysobacter TaxID=2635362 RepID=UPI001BEAAE5D|nr:MULTISPECIES: DUF3606 domain-containing protein [unclassified Lysobacter]MBT2746831.1 DUF3606 domain-containing protein [Lysobacter sp. ISL-42]MBT2750684.1 DUF3606 domain-containing protein [Lysobacter sp. ISL-50]MBT2779513.1 DUF3606 domain-containing protein [Lysobacter sp. ISL-54]MBT2784657.1 DUF3606 domain-containing protein [Lysobacter sp. ISL-52]